MEKSLLDLGSILKSQGLSSLTVEVDEKADPPETLDEVGKKPQLVQLVAKGDSFRVFVRAQANGLSDIAVDCRHWNGAHVDVIVGGTTPSATISAEGSQEEGANYSPLTSSGAAFQNVTASRGWDVHVGSPWLKIRIANISGTYVAGQGFTITVTPFFTAGSHLQGGDTLPVSAAFTRPNDTTAYTAKDTVADATASPNYLTFTGAGRVPGGSGYITGLRIQTDQTTNTAVYRLHLFHTAPTALNDNAACTAPLWADRTKYVGYIDSNSLGVEGSGATAAHGQNYADRVPFHCAEGDANLYGLLETLSAFTPAALQNYYAELDVERN